MSSSRIRAPKPLFPPTRDESTHVEFEVLSMRCRRCNAVLINLRDRSEVGRFQELHGNHREAFVWTVRTVRPVENAGAVMDMTLMPSGLKAGL